MKKILSLVLIFAMIIPALFSTALATLTNIDEEMPTIDTKIQSFHQKAEELFDGKDTAETAKAIDQLDFKYRLLIKIADKIEEGVNLFSVISGVVSAVTAIVFGVKKYVSKEENEASIEFKRTPWREITKQQLKAEIKLHAKIGGITLLAGVAGVASWFGFSKLAQVIGQNLVRVINENFVEKRMLLKKI